MAKKFSDPLAFDSSRTTRRRILAASASALLAGGKISSGPRAAFGFPRDGERAKNLPPPDNRNTLYILALWEDGLDYPYYPYVSVAQLRSQIRKLKREFGAGNAYNRVGFASVYSAGHLPLLLKQLKVFREERIHRGVTFALQTYIYENMRGDGLTNPNGDLRCYQWRLDGKTWRGIGAGRLATLAKSHPSLAEKDQLVVTPSRYAGAIRGEMAQKARQWVGEVKMAMNAYPGVITVIDFAIEQVLAQGGEISDEYLGDYSPFAITEFRDWLLHRGLYAPGARYAGEGAPPEIVGKFVKIGGVLVSPFHLDPAPDDTGGRKGKTFNANFGTNFKTWTLAYWDLEKFPDPIIDPQFNPSPKSGNGSTPGGFDAPRAVDHSRWWKAWSWSYQDNNYTYPPGNPENPAYGFREVEIAHFVRDVANLLIAEGIPKELLYPHQIPGDILGAALARSSASPIWSAFLPQNGHLGITSFGTLDPVFITQYSKNWGIFEWHPAYGQPADSSVLYEQILSDLRKFVPAGCHVLFPGWWYAPVNGKYNNPGRKIFPLNNSNFAKAVHKFLAEQPNTPHWVAG
ncbi:MAG: hypothetical protein ACP5I8_03025 [Phycisphaerae bacterium]